MSWNVDAAPSKVETSGAIIGVVVHGRGAVITRKITVKGPLPNDAFDLVVGGITPLADAGSVRVHLPDGSRKLIAVNARIDIPSVDKGPGATTALVEQLNRQIDRLHRRDHHLNARLERLNSSLVLPRGRKALREEGPLARFEQALALNELLRTRIAAIDEELLTLRTHLTEVTRQRDAAELEDRQTSGAERAGDGHPTRAFDLRIAAGEEALEELHLSYAVPYAAKWWPQYTLRLTDGGTRATLAIEALVAQRTGEDWSNVPLGLSTASIIHDATLPKLPSLRLGKAQPPETRGFREPPTGVGALFESFDAFSGRTRPMMRQSGAMPPPAPSRVTIAEPAVELMMMEETIARYDEADSRMAPSPAMPQAKTKSRKAMAPTPSRNEAPTGMRMASFASAPGSSVGGYGGGGKGGVPPEPPPPPSHEPGADWLEFDALILAGRDDSRRGLLRKRPPASGMPESELFDAQESARRLNLTDPSVSRGMFDYRYDAAGTARVPADGRLHRVAVQEEPATSRLGWKTVPLVDPAVYREAKLANPFSSPLLAGPVDVFSEGQLVTTTQISKVDAGGSMRVGLGIDERIRVARNVRMTEESAGLLGGKRELIHDVEIEVRSGVNMPISVEVVDRVPVTSDDHVDIELESESMSGHDYDQAELDHPIEGGRRWNVEIPAGGRKTITMRYQVTLRSKDELVGGNRRD